MMLTKKTCVLVFAGILLSTVVVHHSLTVNFTKQTSWHQSGQNGTGPNSGRSGDQQSAPREVLTGDQQRLASEILGRDHQRLAPGNLNEDKLKLAPEATNGDNRKLAPEATVTNGDNQKLAPEATVGDKLRTAPESPELVEAGAQESDVQQILLWNSWYQWKDFQFGIGQDPFIKHCGTDRCSTTIERSDLNTSSAVVFFGRLLPYKNLKKQQEVLPKRHSSRQYFVYSNLESPVGTFGNTKSLGSQINITMTYRRDSTITWLEYDVIRCGDQSVSGTPCVHRPPSTIEVSGKTHQVAWMISHCSKSATRMKYARELGKHIPVDVYGACGELTCNRRAMSTCMELLEMKYLFYLSFENSICTDYLTEKVYRTLQYNLVPVVMGGADYSSILPPNSYIDVRDFNSPQELASHLLYLSEHRGEYMKYFDWKVSYVIQKVHVSTVFCELCSFLQTQAGVAEAPPRTVDIGEWWDGQHCELNDSKLEDKFHLK